MKPRTVEQWLAMLGAGYDGPPESRDERVMKALERLFTGLQRERHAWGVLRGNFGLGRTVRDVKKALSGEVRWPESPEA